jgi:hypothetical protein
MKMKNNKTETYGGIMNKISIFAFALILMMCASCSDDDGGETPDVGDTGPADVVEDVVEGSGDPPGDDVVEDDVVEDTGVLLDGEDLPAEGSGEGSGTPEPQE